jgi:hypothetical protein
LLGKFARQTYTYNNIDGKKSRALMLANCQTLP